MKRCHERFFNHNFVDENKVTQPIFCDEISFDRGKLNVSICPKFETGFDYIADNSTCSLFSKHITLLG